MASNNPLVSVIIPTYNRAQEVCRAIESVLAQTYKPIEIIVVDDGSNDGTEAALGKYGHSINYIRQNNAGVSVARNRGIAEADGEVITFLDSDDLWLPQKTEIQVTLLKRGGENVPCCICNTIMRYPDDETTFYSRNKLMANKDEGLWTNVSEVGASRFVFLVQSMAIRRQFMGSDKAFDESLWVMEDQDFGMRLAKMGPWAYTIQSLVVWHGGSRHSLCLQAEQDSERYYSCLAKVYKQLLDDPGIGTLSSRQSLEHRLCMAKLMNKASWFSRQKKSVLCRGIRDYVRVADAIWRRLPGRFPHVDVTTFPV